MRAGRSLCVKSCTGRDATGLGNYPAKRSGSVWEDAGAGPRERRRFVGGTDSNRYGGRLQLRSSTVNEPTSARSQLTKSERIGHALVALPIAHVLGSALYLWSYCTGFGAGLIVHASISDIVSVSVTDMVRAYFLSLIMPALGVIGRYATGKPYWYSGTEHLPEGSAEIVRANSMKKVVSYAIVSLVTFFVLLSIYVYIDRGYIDYGLLQFPIMIPSIVVLMKICERARVSAVTYEVLAILTIFVYSIILTGLGNGQRDRLMAYKRSLNEYTSCDTKTILRRFGERYLVILPNNSKALVSTECKVIFGVPNSKRSK